jgi:L,D-peptidoglycan transpeptidase YkuD (ErfK/YbiS/YcfS/YnhG family)
MQNPSYPFRRSLIARTVFPLFLVVPVVPVLSPAQVIDPTALSRQLVVVTADGWDAPRGELWCFERDTLGAAWEAIGPAAPVNIGRAGLAWGAGLQGSSLPEGPRKREGDGKSPAGVFRLGRVFGYAPADSARFVAMPYVVADSTCECVDDTNSVYYNSLVEPRWVREKDWHSSEHMGKSGIAYRWGVIIDYNTSPRIPGEGSCIFLHVSEGPDVPTTGCTAVEESRLLAIIAWLDPRKNPVIVQMPAAEYARLRAGWALPMLDQKSE